ncbi:MAG: PEGA domain-containing protein, partial [Spirochaetota bacterium]
YKKRLIENEKLKVGLQLAALYEKSDSMFFFKSPDTTEYKRLSESIKMNNEKISFLQKADFEKITIVNNKTIIFKKSSDGTHLLPLPVVSVKETSEANELDFHIWGTIEEVEGYFYLEITAYSNAFQSTIYQYTNAFTRDEVSEAVKEAGRGIKTFILGREWANLNIATEPEVGDIFINDTYYGMGNVHLQVVKPGRYNIQVISPGYKEETRTVEVAPYEEKEYTVTLRKEEPAYVSIASYPQGSDVYVASNWVGKTPLKIQKVDDLQDVLVKSESYNDYEFALTPGTTDTVKFQLSPALFDRKALIDTTRDNFYYAFSFFVLSVPIPIIFYNLSVDFAAALLTAKAESNIDEINRLERRSSLCYSAYLGGMVVTTSLFVNTLIYLVEYIAVSDATKKK